MCGGHIGIDDRDRIFVLCVKFIFKLGQFELVAGLELELGCFFSHVEATISCNPFVFCSGQLKRNFRHYVCATLDGVYVCLNLGETEALKAWSSVLVTGICLTVNRVNFAFVIRVNQSVQLNLSIL
jgi:hypothetical protein